MFMTTFIYHIAQRDVWDAAQESGLYHVESLVSEGFIHGSQYGQILKVANAFYRGQRDLVLLCIDAARIQADVYYEAPAHPDGVASPTDIHDADRFPHIYGALNIDAVVRVVDFPPGDDGTFALPKDIVK